MMNFTMTTKNEEDADLIEKKITLARKYTNAVLKFYCFCGFDRNDKWDADFWRQDIFDLLFRICGKNYRRKTTAYNVVWCCATFNTKGKKYCASKVIPEATLQMASAEVLGMTCFDEGVFRQQIPIRTQHR